MRTFAAALLALTSPLLVPASASAAEAPRACEALAEVIVPDGNKDVQLEALLKATYDALERQSPTMLVLEDSYPGMRVAILDAIRPILRDSVAATTPLYRADLARFYCANLTPAEAGDSLAFWTSPTGAKVVGGVGDAIGYTASAERLAASQDVESAQLRKDAATAGIRAVARLSPAEREEVGRFFLSPSGRKLFSLNARKNAIDVKWMNYAPPGSEKAVEQAVVDTMIAHIAQTDPDMAQGIRDRLKRGK